MDQIQDDLTCQICQGYYKQPKALPCIHSFCESCLRDYVFSRGFDAAGHFPCPLCRADTPIPTGGVGDFPLNHLLQSLIDTLRQGGQLMDSVVSTETGSGLLGGQSGGDNGRINDSRGSTSNGNESNQRTSNQHGSSENRGLNSGAGQTRSDGRSNHPTSRQNSQQGVPRVTTPTAPTRPSSPPVLRVSNMGAYAEALDVPVKHDRHKAKVIFGKYGTGLAHFEEPMGLSFTNHFGETLIHVTDQRSTRIMAFKLEGKIHTIFTTQGQLHDITSDRLNTLYVAISNAPNKEALVVSYDLTGTPLNKFGNMFSFVKPSGVAFDRKFNRVIVTSVEEKQAYIFNKEGTLVQKFGKRGKGPDAFLTPNHVAINSYGHIIISDSESHCLKVFDRNGKSKYAIGQKGRRHGDLFEPRGIAIDDDNNILVADSGNQRIQVFDSQGKFVDVLLNKLDQRGFPEGIAVYAHALALSGGWLAVLYKGRGFAEVRVYEYQSPSTDRRVKNLSNVCTCQ